MQNVLERAVVLARGLVVDVPDPLRSSAEVSAGSTDGSEFATLVDAEWAHMREALRRGGSSFTARTGRPHFST